MDINTSYIDQFLRLKCVSDIIERRFYKSAKDITEGMALLNAIRAVAPDLMKSESVKLVEICNGSALKIAGLMAFLTRWECAAVGKELPRTPYNAARLLVAPGSPRGYQITSVKSPVVVCAVDPQYRLEDILEDIDCPELYVFSAQNGSNTYFSGYTPIESFNDDAVLSDRNIISAYHFEAAKHLWIEKK
jgi:hypothetical protein